MGQPYDIDLAVETHGGSSHPLPASQKHTGGLTVLDEMAKAILSNPTLDMVKLKPQQIAYTAYKIAQAVVAMRKTFVEPIKQAERLGLQASKPIHK